MGATDVFGRIATSLYGKEALPPTFSACYDVPDGGVLLALPALLAIGLLRHSEKYFELPSGFYRLDSIFLVLAFMALARIKTVEKLRYCSPGEWGKLLGLDRIPEARTLRGKIGILSQQGEPYQWAGELSREWLGMEPEASTLIRIEPPLLTFSEPPSILPKSE